MKGTLKCVRLHPIMQELFGIQPSGRTFGSATVEFEFDHPWVDDIASFSEKIYIYKVNDIEIPKQLAWVDVITNKAHELFSLKFELNGNMFIIDDISG